jgi:nucleotide-binding universal stress UspA family protein
MFKKILWPTDLSENSKTALPQILSLSKTYQAEVHVLYVMETLASESSWYKEFGRSRIQEIQAQEEKNLEKQLDELRTTALAECPSCITHVAAGDPPHEIIEYANKENIDLVVMATQGRRGYFLFGSVTERVLKHSPVPVIAIPTPK